VVEAGAVEAEAAAPRVDEVSDAAPAPDAEPEAEPGGAPPSDVSHDSENQSEQ